MMSHQHEKEAVCNSVGLMLLVFGVVEVFIGLSLAPEVSQHCDLDRPVYIRLVLHTAARGHEGCLRIWGFGDMQSVQTAWSFLMYIVSPPLRESRKECVNSFFALLPN